jgi:hypothetical protein
MTPCRDYPDGIRTCLCIHCQRRFLGKSGHCKVCQACAHERRIRKAPKYFILLERGALERMVVGPYTSHLAATEDFKYWDKRHGWRAFVRPLMKSVKLPRGPADGVPARLD